MKIHFVADLEKRKFEGRTKTALALKTFLEKKGCIFVDSPKEAEVIHFHSSGIADSFRAARWKKKYGKPVVYTLYSTSKTEILNHFRNHLAQNFYFHPRKTSFFLSYSAILPLRWRGYKLKKLDKVVVPSLFLKKRLFENTKLIRIGVNTDYFKPIKNKKENKNYSNYYQNDSQDYPNDSKIKVGYFGHPSVYKGVIDFARASKRFPANFASYIHVTKLTPKIRRTLHKINSELKISGLVDDIRKTYSEMDIIVLPYRSYLGAIANPLVLMEAMSCGKPVITTNLDYIKEITDGAAVIVKPYSPKQISRAVKDLRDADLRKKLGKMARQIIKAKFEQEKSFNEYFNLYQELTEK